DSSLKTPLLSRLIEVCWGSGTSALAPSVASWFWGPLASAVASLWTVPASTWGWPIVYVALQLVLPPGTRLASTQVTVMARLSVTAIEDTVTLQVIVPV